MRLPGLQCVLGRGGSASNSGNVSSQRVACRPRASPRHCSVASHALVGARAVGLRKAWRYDAAAPRAPQSIMWSILGRFEASSQGYRQPFCMDVHLSCCKKLLAHEIQTEAGSREWISWSTAQTEALFAYTPGRPEGRTRDLSTSLQVVLPARVLLQSILAQPLRPLLRSRGLRPYLFLRTTE